MNVVVFWEEGFPFIDATPLTLDALRTAFSSKVTVRFLAAAELAAALDSDPDLFVNPYGSAFPKAVWSAFAAYLRRGGNWVNLGGAPLSRPVRREKEYGSMGVWEYGSMGVTNAHTPILPYSHTPGTWRLRRWPTAKPCGSTRRSP